MSHVDLPHVEGSPIERAHSRTRLTPYAHRAWQDRLPNGRIAVMRWRQPAARCALIAVVVLIAGTGCSNDPLAEDHRVDGGTEFVATDGSRVDELQPDERSSPVEFAGTLDTGARVTSDDYRGRVTVVNFWYAGCGPCRAEAQLLEAAHLALQDQDVAFLGVNLQDGAAASQAFAETYGVTYPSALATIDGSVKLAFAGQTPLNAAPSTLVLDRDGRVATRIIGQLRDGSILETVVHALLEEHS